MRPGRVLFGVVASLFILASSATGTEFNKLTYFTFSAPVQLPGVTLPAGTYRFELANPRIDRSILAISNKAGTQRYAMLMTIPTERLKAADEPIIVFRETPRGQPSAIQSWFYPGERAGQQLMYSPARPQIAQKTHSVGSSASKRTSRSKVRALKTTTATGVKSQSHE